MRSSSRWIAMAVLAAAAVVPAGAQEAEAPSLHAELAALNATMARIAELLERQLEGQKIELVMVRVRIATERMQRTDQELSAAEAEKTSLEDEKQRLQLNYKSYFASLENSKDAPIEQLTQMRDEFDAQSQRLDARLRTVGQRILELQNALASQQTEVQEWQDFVDRLLNAL